MWSGATPQWLDALTRSQGLYVRVEVWFADQLVSTVDVDSGAVAVTARNRVRRKLKIAVPERLWPALDTDLLAPYGPRLKVFRGILDGAGALVGGRPAPVFAGRVEQVGEYDRRSGSVPVAAVDPFADINDAQFEEPFIPQAGTRITTVIGQLVVEVHPGAVVDDRTGSVATVPDGIMWDTDRGKAIDDLAAAIGAEVFFEPDGITCVIRPVPTLDGLPVWTLSTGAGGVIVRDTRSKSRTDVANRLIVHVERPNATPLLVRCTDDRAASPIRYGGPYGKVVRHMSNPLITDAAQATVAGNARLARSIGLTRTRAIECPPNPALEAGDLIAVVTDDGVELHIADAFPVGLGPDDTMTIATRSTHTSADDS